MQEYNLSSGGICQKVSVRTGRAGNILTVPRWSLSSTRMRGRDKL
jgi:hypothetical protein